MTTSHGSRHRPYKVWSCDRQTRKSVVASSLRELKEKGSEKLGYGSQTHLQQQQHESPLRLVLESDGTEVEEDPYFQMVPADTVFLLLRPAEKWLPPGVEALRAADHDSLDSGLSSAPESELNSIVNSLRMDIANIILLDERKLQLVAEMDVAVEGRNGSDRQLLALLKETADRLLLDRQSFQETRDVLNLLSKSQDNLDGPPIAAPSPNPSEVSRLFQEARQLLNQLSDSSNNQPGAKMTRPTRKRKR